MNIQEIALETYNEHKEVGEEYDMFCGRFCPSIMEKLKAKISKNFPEKYNEMMGDICHEMMRLAEVEEAKVYADLKAYIHEMAVKHYEEHEKIGRHKALGMGLCDGGLSNKLWAEMEKIRSEDYQEITPQIEHEAFSYALEQSKASR